MKIIMKIILKFKHQLNKSNELLSRETILIAGGLVLVVPCTSSRVQERAVYSNHVFFPADTGELTRDTIAQAHLIQPIEVGFFRKENGKTEY